MYVVFARPYRVLSLILCQERHFTSSTLCGVILRQDTRSLGRYFYFQFHFYSRKYPVSRLVILLQDAHRGTADLEASKPLPFCQTHNRIVFFTNSLDIDNWIGRDDPFFSSLLSFSSSYLYLDTVYISLLSALYHLRHFPRSPWLLRSIKCFFYNTVTRKQPVLGLLHYGKNHFGQYWNHDYSNNYFEKLWCIYS